MNTPRGIHVLRASLLCFSSAPRAPGHALCGCCTPAADPCRSNAATAFSAQRHVLQPRRRSRSSRPPALLRSRHLRLPRHHRRSRAIERRVRRLLHVGVRRRFFASISFFCACSAETRTPAQPSSAAARAARPRSPPPSTSAAAALSPRASSAMRESSCAFSFCNLLALAQRLGPVAPARAGRPGPRWSARPAYRPCHRRRRRWRRRARRGKHPLHAASVLAAFMLFNLQSCTGCALPFSFTGSRGHGVHHARHLVEDRLWRPALPRRAPATRGAGPGSPRRR